MHGRIRTLLGAEDLWSPNPPAAFAWRLFAGLGLPQCGAEPYAMTLTPCLSLVAKCPEMLILAGVCVGQTGTVWAENVPLPEIQKGQGDAGDNMGQRRQPREDFTLVVPRKGCHVPINTAAQLSETLYSLLIYFQEPFSPKRSFDTGFSQSKGTRSKATSHAFQHPQPSS